MYLLVAFKILRNGECGNILYEAWSDLRFLEREFFQIRGEYEHSIL